MKQKKSSFIIDWVLINEIAVGPAPRKNNHLLKLKDMGIKCVLSLCSKEEANPPESLEDEFICSRLVLPDHRVNRDIEFKELLLALKLLGNLKLSGPVFVHCVASVERSPLVCMAWLIQNQGLAPQASLDYLTQVHPRTNPLPTEYKLLQKLVKNDQLM